MLTASLIGMTVAIAAVLGAGITAYLWLVRRPQLETSTGIQTLAAMRWREFSHFVIDALRDRGFEPDLESPQPPKGQQADLLLLLNDKTWLLGCKQGADQVITPSQVAELARSVRQSGAVGGILATLGKIDPAAREDSQGIELLDGVTLWKLIEPLLPQSLQDHLVKRSHTATLRSIQWSWLGALVVGLTLATLLAPSAQDAAPVSAKPVPVAASDTPSSPAATAPAGEAPVTPESEQQRRDEVMREISMLPGIEEALWSTRSTLLVYLEDEQATDQELATLCAILERYDELRASRLQLQPPSGSSKPVRFKQCRPY